MNTISVCSSPLVLGKFTVGMVSYASCSTYPPSKVRSIPYLQQVQLRDGSGDWVGGRGSPRKEPQSMLQPKSWIFEASDDQLDYTVLPMKKDVDRTG